MYDYDIVYIKGNPNSGSKEQHECIDKSIIDLMKNYKYKIISSNQSNKEFMDKIPKAKVYIGFSRGTRYLKKLNKNALKLSIGGISGSGIFLFLNDEDEVINGDISISSMKAHFIIKKSDKEKIEVLIDKYFKLNIRRY